ncbi:MAG TPA: HD domain-containing protein [Thermosynechococcaceae cyanobacterium]
MLPNSERTYHDPLQGAIVLDQADPTEALLIQLIDTPAFQRLRRVRQLGPASLTYHGAESSRFTHSLGVMAIARRAFDRLAKANPTLQPHRAVVLCAALLHDIGHAPFSHTAEEIFGCHHEHWTARILGESSPIRALLDGFDPALLEQLISVYQHTYPIPLVWQLVSSQLDCDRLDYLMRDSYFTGTSYGKIDLDRILMAMTYDPVTQQLVVARKGMAAIEHYLIVRYFMYAQVYNHPKNIAATWILYHAFTRARELIAELSADETMSQWLTQNCNYLPLAAYLAADDGVFTYHLQRWQHHSDRVLSDLCRRYVDRDLFKALDVTRKTEVERLDLLQKVQGWLREIDLDPPYYAGMSVSFSRGYTLYQRGIKFQTSRGLEELSQLSPLVQTLTTSHQRVWFIYPREIEAQVLAVGA